MDDLAECQRQLSDAKDILRGLTWAARQVVRETFVGMTPWTARRKSIELLAEALRDPRMREILG